MLRRIQPDTCFSMAFRIFFSLFALLEISSAQVTSSAQCFDFAKTEMISSFFTQCNSLSSTFTACQTLDGEQLHSCRCKQEVFDLIYGCKDEVRECLHGGASDNNADNVLSYWNMECSSRVASSLTTPAQTSLSQTLAPVNVCQDVAASCAAGNLATRDCKTSHSGDLSKLSSCICKDELLSTASYCEYFGNKTCGLIPATLTNVDLFQGCPTQASSFIAALSTAASSSGVISLSGSQGPSDSSAPGAAISAVGPTASPTVDNKSSAPELHHIPFQLLCGTALFELLLQLLLF